MKSRPSICSILSTNACFGQYVACSELEILWKFVEFPTFGAAVDEFFAKVEAQKIEAQVVAQKADANKKVNRVRNAIAKQVQALDDQAAEHEEMATLLELNHEEALWAIVKEEQRKGNPLANLIHSVNFAANEVVLLLTDPHEEDMSKPAMRVPVDISMGAFANARDLHTNRKGAEFKKEKTVKASAKGLKAAEAKAEKGMKQHKITAQITELRKVYWFEKFVWFVTSEGYMCLCGRDAQQNEMLVKRYMEKGDVYVHADLHGAGTLIIKNPSGEPIPPLTLQQANNAGPALAELSDDSFPVTNHLMYTF